MYLFRTGSELKNYLKNRHASIHFVPTMGALHKGHMELISQASSPDSIVVCSIFINPTQFNDNDDFAKYPITIEQDIILLEASNCEVLFLPSVDEIYPFGKEYEVNIDLNGIDEVMEGAVRPGHFKGVIQVVERLLGIVQPDRIYMGQKDYQQQLIITALINQRFPKTTLIRVNTVREVDGLAMSSRNVRLDKKMRENAHVIYKTLLTVAESLPSHELSEILKTARNSINNTGLMIEYIEIRDAFTLKEKTHVVPGEKVVIFVAAKAGDLRLIDNLLWPDCNF